MKIRGRPKPLHERDSAALALVDTVVARQPAVKAKYRPDEDLQDGGHHFRIVSQTIAQGERQGENPLPDGYAVKHTVDKVRRCVDHLLIAAPYRACVRSRSRGVRNRRDKRICLCKTAAGADPCRTIHTGVVKSRRPRYRKTGTPASRVQQIAEPRGHVLAGERERFPDARRSSDTTESLPDSVADRHFCQSIRMQRTNDPKPAWPKRSKPHTGRPVPRID